jgi:DGQHR domain-containing protein
MTPITIIAAEEANLDTTCYRGAAPLAELARISQADIFDQVDNPEGLQRDLNRKHAADAYTYVSAKPDPERPRAYPEVVLNVRDRKVLKREVLFEGSGVKLVELTFDTDAILKARSVKVSRVDGNHRLFYAAGDGKERLPVDTPAPFQLHVGLTRDQETDIFSTINHEQKGLNTSHLAVLRSRITPDDVELKQRPARVYARRLAADAASPWVDMVHMGGSRAGQKEAGTYLPITFIALEHGVQRTLKKSAYLSTLDADAQYGLVRAFWQATAAVFSQEFAEPRDYLVVKNLGVQALSALAALVIDRCFIAGKVEVGHMVPFLEAAKGAVDWHKDSTQVAGMSGNRAVNLLAGAMGEALPLTPDEYKEPSELLPQEVAA